MSCPKPLPKRTLPPFPFYPVPSFLPPSRCKLTTYASLLSACISGLAFGLFGPSTATAQITPPFTSIPWVYNSDGDWGTASNWLGNAVPASGADVVFGPVSGGIPDPDEPTITVSGIGTTTLKSLWFDTAGGVWYTLGSGGALMLGGGLPNDGNAITVLSSLPSATENNIESRVIFDNSEPGRNLWIRNDSFGGLRFSDKLDIGSQNLVVSSTGQPFAHSAVHFNGMIYGKGNISVVNGWAQHLVLQADNINWKGSLNVGAGTLTFIKGRTALGTGANIVSSGGTLAWRRHLVPGYISTYGHPIEVSGPGAVRTWGKPAVGAIYNDGGQSIHWHKITLTGDTSFGSRGDIFGNLTLGGTITGGSYTFTKVGLGLITLFNDNNSWGQTVIREGVLRRARNTALPNGNLVFDGGILELASGPIGPGINFSRNLGTGPGQVRWIGSGGFSNFTGGTGEVRRVRLNGGAELTWGSGYFAPAIGTREFLLSSRYADAPIDFTNPTKLNNSWWAGRVERGATVSAHAIISGDISSVGFADNTKGFYKMGLGLLWLTGENNTYIYKTGIHDGALGGIPATSIINFSGYGPPESRGGVIALKEDFTRTLGESNGSYVSWHILSKGGGFAAYEGDRTVRLNNSTSLIHWGGDGSFIHDGQVLKFGHYTSSGTVLWDKALGLGAGGNRVIHIDRGLLNGGRADVSFIQPISGTSGAAGGSLTIQGDGRMDIAVDNPNLKLATINIHGAELRLQQNGRIAAGATNFYLKNGGTFTVDEMGTHNSSTGGFGLDDSRLAMDEERNPLSEITLNAGTLRYWAPNGDHYNGIVFKKITLEDGASTFEVKAHNGHFAGIGASILHRAIDSVSTLNFERNDELALFITMEVPSTAPGPYAINYSGGVKIVPWMTVNGRDWAAPEVYEASPPGYATYYGPLGTYHTMDANTWSVAQNVWMRTDQVLSGIITHVNSLRMSNGELNLNGSMLQIGSGGLLIPRFDPSSQAYGPVSITGNSIITNNGALVYVHTYAPLTVKGAARFVISWGQFFGPLIKTGPAELILNSSGEHRIGSLYIHQGVVDLQQGNLYATHIIIGDGAGKDELWLPADRWNPLSLTFSKPNITLRGTPYGPGAEYATYNPDEAILRMGGNTKQTIGTLRIEDRGTIDWVGGEVGKANMLFVDKLEFNNADARLFMRNWYEFEDYLLVKKIGFDHGVLGKIIFDGLWDLPALAVSYDANYYVITPYNSPEPGTYGAILGAVGIGLWTWRRKKRPQRLGLRPRRSAK